MAFGSRKKQPNFKFDLGDKLVDTVTGFEGIVTSRTQWIHNCNVYGLQSAELKDGKPRDREHFDEPQLKVVKEKRTTGWPCNSVKQTNR